MRYLVTFWLSLGVGVLLASSEQRLGILLCYLKMHRTTPCPPPFAIAKNKNRNKTTKNPNLTQNASFAPMEKSCSSSGIQPIQHVETMVSVCHQLSQVTYFWLPRSMCVLLKIIFYFKSAISRLLINSAICPAQHCHLYNGLSFSAVTADPPFPILSPFASFPLSSGCFPSSAEHWHLAYIPFPVTNPLLLPRVLCLHGGATQLCGFEPPTCLSPQASSVHRATRSHGHTWVGPRIPSSCSVSDTTQPLCSYQDLFSVQLTYLAASTGVVPWPHCVSHPVLLLPAGPAAPLSLISLRIQFTSYHSFKFLIYLAPRMFYAFYRQILDSDEPTIHVSMLT